MKLGALLDGVPVSKLFQTMYGHMVVTHDVQIHRLQYDSRKVVRGDAFVALTGSAADGHAFIGQAINQGAKAVVMERDDAVSDPQCMHAGVVKIVVQNSRKALARMAANFFGRPAEHLKVVGVTGTNGKTTTSHIMQSVLEAGGMRSGLLGTIEVRYGSIVMPATHTTPESLELQDAFARMREAGCTAVAMEVSSHALAQSRVEGIPFACGIFTNLTQDHLDYHGTMDAYAAAKRTLFDTLDPAAAAVVNADDPWSATMTSGTRARVVSYGESGSAAVRLTNAEMSIEGSALTVSSQGKDFDVATPLVGRFNVMNVLGAVAAGLALNIPLSAVQAGIAAAGRVNGRFERVQSAKGWTAIIDYAHTPDALRKCLEAIRDVLAEADAGKIITVFGAGGDRDRAKRPLMGAVVSELSDEIIVTSDNPRTENPEAILDDIIRGIPRGKPVRRESDRRAAIELAASIAGRHDVILIAGKGHEDYQVIGNEKRHFSDREEIEALA